MAKKGLDSKIIISTAAQLVEEKGYDHFSLNELALKLGVKTASLYNHIEGLQEVNSKVSHLAVSRLHLILEASIARKERDEALMSLTLAYRDFAKKNPELYKAVIKLPTSEDDQLKESGAQVVEPIIAILRKYALNEVDRIHFSRALRSAIHGFVEMEEAGFFRRHDANIDISYEKMIEGYIVILNSYNN
ncbi:TetR/AcrR family transcriptional regulator [Acetobacterium tundrae]|uniref:TetR family transcriptional regulator n=1 Tax=Acetobacterium tundrae TaxID=132932 RepID=A0ABR6WQZ7_9FIRM|nr:TetR/AcrR family transcriptional regulator [Acetobacterium tundrae]MBC3798552.1 TetR family transcriptional regulator [Acetobacterium tundrae]